MKLLRLNFHEVLDIGEGEVLVIFHLPGMAPQQLVMRGVEFDRGLVKEEAPKPPPPPKPLTREERIAKALGAKAPSNEIISAERPPQVVAAVPLEEVTPVKDDGLNAKLAELGLVHRADPTTSLFKINNDAGRDGSNPDLSTLRTLIEIESDKRVHPALRADAFKRLCAPTLSYLNGMRRHFPDELAQRIGLKRCQDLGTGPQGIGGNYIPADWASFIQGDGRSIAFEAATGANISVPEARPPQIFVPEAELNAHAQQTLFPQTSSLDALISKWQSATVSGNESLKGE